MHTGKPVFIASCVFTREYPEVSRAVQNYLKSRFRMAIMRCCVKNYKTRFFEDAMPAWLLADWQSLPAYIDVGADNTLLYICHNCAAIVQEQMPDVPMMSFWELVLSDDEFVYPDYAREEITLQDCWRTYDNSKEQAAVRALLKKMNFTVIEQAENRENTNFCGVSLFAPAPERNLKLAPQRFVEGARGKFIQHSDEEQRQFMRAHCANIMTEKVVAYCHYCIKGIVMGGKQGIHLAELLFPDARSG